MASPLAHNINTAGALIPETLSLVHIITKQGFTKQGFTMVAYRPRLWLMAAGETSSTSIKN
eukprot:37100-Pelagomonas_calceolata.AAC.1